MTHEYAMIRTTPRRDEMLVVIRHDEHRSHHSRIQLIRGIGRNSMENSVKQNTKLNQPKNPRRTSLLHIFSRAARATQTLDIDVDG